MITVDGKSFSIIFIHFHILWLIWTFWDRFLF